MRKLNIDKKSGTPKQILEFVFKENQKNGNSDPVEFKRKEMKNEIKASFGVIELSIRRLQIGGYLLRVPGKIGCQGFRRLKLSDDVYEQFLERENART